MLRARGCTGWSLTSFPLSPAQSKSPNPCTDGPYPSLLPPLPQIKVAESVAAMRAASPAAVAAAGQQQQGSTAAAGTDAAAASSGPQFKVHVEGSRSTPSAPTGAGTGDGQSNFHPVVSSHTICPQIPRLLRSLPLQVPFVFPGLGPTTCSTPFHTNHLQANSHSHTFPHLQVQVVYLKSWDRFGRARVECSGGEHYEDLDLFLSDLDLGLGPALGIRGMLCLRAPCLASTEGLPPHTRFSIPTSPHPTLQHLTQDFRSLPPHTPHLNRLRVHTCRGGGVVGSEGVTAAGGGGACAGAVRPRAGQGGRGAVQPHANGEMGT